MKSVQKSQPHASLLLHVLRRKRKEELLAADVVEADVDAGIIARACDRLNHAATELLVLYLVARLVEPAARAAAFFTTGSSPER